MKQIIIFIVLLFGLSSCTQKNKSIESNKSNEELIYSDTTLNKLKLIADSLNLQFKACVLNKTYLSKPQAKAYYVSLYNGDLIEAIKDFKADIFLDDFIKKYSGAKVEKDLLIVKSKYKNSEAKYVTEFSSIEYDEYYAHVLTFEKNLKSYDFPLKGKWIYKYNAKTDYSEEYLEAFYFTENFSQQTIPEIYSEMIQYSDCIIDTVTQVFHIKNHSGKISNNQELSKSKKFIAYIYKSTNKPVYIEDDKGNGYDIYKANYKVWESLRLSRVDSLRKNDEKFITLLNEAVIEALSIGGTQDEFEEYVGLYYSKKAELELKRNRVIIGGCSNDTRPRDHALNIAKLSAETLNWGVFIRTHLDLLNDSFKRASDASSEWKKRKTFIHELELLDINVLDLIIGISLIIDNPCNNHYFGSIARLGKAISEAKISSKIESKMLQMISDNQLDDYNRMLIYYLFLNYNNNIDDKEKQTENHDKLLIAVRCLPIYLSTKIIAGK